MDNRAWEGVILAVITALCGFAVATSRHPSLKLGFSLAAIGTGTMAVDCFAITTRATYQ